MKKLFALLVSATLIVPMVGCGGKKEEPKKDPAPAAGGTDKPADGKLPVEEKK